jgi:uncharacterized phosphosugar-binding protein
MAAEFYRAYLDQIQRLLDAARAQAAGPIPKAAELIASALGAGRVLYVFGPSHAGLMVQDLFYRAGGLLPIEPILPAGLMLNERPITRTSALERLPGFAEVLLQDLALGPEDVLLLASVSGRNPVVVEMCAAAQARGARVIALTNLAYSKSVAPRSGTKRLFEAADIVIDLPGVPGDAVMALDGLEQRVGPTSTSLGSAILQGLMVEVCARLLAQGFPPPVLVSANLDGGDQANQRLFNLYRSKLSYL